MAERPTGDRQQATGHQTRKRTGSGKNGGDDGLSQSFSAALQAVKKSPDSEEAWAHVEELADGLQRPDEVAAAYREALDGQLTRAVRDTLSRRAAAFHDEWFGDNPEAMASLLLRIIDRDPEANWAFERMTVVLTVAERWDDLLAIYDRALQTTTEPKARKRLLDDAAHVAKDFAHSSARAVDYMQLQLELDPSNTKLANSIERLLGRQKRWEDLVELWQGRIESLPVAEARETRLKIAQTFLDHLDAAGPALEELGALVDEVPGHAGACAQLERILASDVAGTPIRLQALALLRSNYKAAGRPADIVGALEQALVFAEPEQQLALRREAGQRLAILSRDTEALAHYAALLKQEPTDADARRQMRQLARRSDLHSAHAEGLIAAAEGAEPAQTAALLIEAGHTCREEVGEPDRAIELYRRVVELSDADASMALSAAHHLNELLATAGRDAERLDALERLAELEQASVVRRAVLGEVGQLADQLGDPDRALKAYALRIETDANDLAAIDASIEVLARGERWEPLVGALRRRADTTVVAQQRRADLLRVAKIQSEKLESDPDAIETWLQVRREFGDEVETITALDALLGEMDRWPELAKILLGAAQTRRARSAALLVRLGEIHHTQLGQAPEATKYFRQALGVEPANARARAGLRDLMDLPECTRPAVEALVRAYHATDDWQSLLEIVDARTAAAAEPREAVEVLREAATLHESRGDDPSAAQTATAQAFVLDPQSPGLEHDLTRLAGITGDWDAAASAFSEAAAAAKNPSRAAALRREEGRVREVELADAEGAVQAYASAAEREPADLTTQRSIIRASAKAGTWPQTAAAATAICKARELVDADAIEAIAAAAEAQGAWDGMVPAMEEEVTAASLPPTLARELAAMCARWHREKRSDNDAAEAAAQRAVQLDPDHRPTLELLADLQRDNTGAGDDSGGSVALCETLLKIDALADRELSALREAARMAVRTGADPVWTRDVVARLYRKAARLFARVDEVVGADKPAGTAIWALEQLVQMDCEAGHRDQAIRLLLSASQLPLPRDRALDLRVRAARLLLENGDHGRAIDMYHRVVEERRDDLTLVTELADLCEREGRIVELVNVRARELELTEAGDRRLALRLEISRWVGELEKRGGRVESLLQNLEERPGHRASVEALTEVLQGKGQHRELAAALADQAARLEEAGEGPRAAELWSTVARLVEERFSDVDRAIEALQRVVDLAPTGDALDSLARLHLQRGEPAAAAAVLERRLDSTDAAQRVPVLLRLARAQIKAEAPDDAIATLQAAFSEAPKSGEVRKLLFKLYREREQWEPLAQALTVASEHVSDTDTILAYAQEATDLYHDKLGTPDQAVPVLERAHALAPDDRWLRSRLAEGLRVAGRLDESRELLSGLIQDYGRRRSAARAQAHLQLARVVHAQGDTAEAIDQLEKASTMDSGNPTIMRTLAEMAKESGEIEKAERAYRALLLQVKRRDDEARTRDPVGPAEVLFELSQISQGRGQDEQAAELFESALEELAKDDSDGPRLQQLLRDRGEFELLQRVLDARMVHADTARRRADVLSDLAQLQEEQLHDSAGAFESRLSAMRADPGAPEHHDRARALASKLERHRDYRDALEDLLDKTRRTTDAYVRCELLLRLAETLASEAEDGTKPDFERAAELLTQAESTGVREVDVWRAAARVAGARADKSAQVQYLERLAALGEDEVETRADAQYRMAEVYLADPDTVERGIDALSEALDAHPRYERASRILTRATEGDDHSAELLQLFERVARKTADDATLLVAVERRAAHPQTDPEHLREAVALAHKMGETERAEALMLRAVELGTSLLDGRERTDWARLGLAAHRRDAGDLAGAVKWLTEAIETAQSEELFAMGREIAELAAAPGGDMSLAVKLYESLLERDPSARDAWEPLAGLYRQLGDLDRLHRLVDETLDSLQTSAERNALRIELSQTMLGDDREAEARELLRNVLLEDPEHNDAQRILTDLLEKSGNEAELIALLRQRLMSAQDRKDTEAVVAASMKLGGRLAQSDGEEALSTLRGALEWAPGDIGLLRAVLEALADHGDEAERTEIIERLIAVELPEAAALLAVELADGYAAADDGDAELRALVLGYRRAPGHDDLRKRLEQAYEQRGDYRGLAQMLIASADGEGSAEIRVQLLRQAAQIHRELLSDPETGADILERAHAAAPDDAGLALELASALASAGKFERASTLVSGLLEDPDLDDSARLQLLATRADLRASTGDIEGTVADLEDALVLDAAGITDRLADALDRKRTAAAERSDLDGERDATLRQVEVLLMQDQRARARDVLEGWIERERKDVTALRLLREIDSAEEHWESVAKINARLVAVEAGDAQTEAALGLAHACMEMGNPQQARAGLEHARRKQPENREIRAELIRIYDALGAESELTKLLSQEADEATNPEERLALKRRVADLFVKQGDTEAALPIIKEVLELKPGDAQATVTLADAHIARGEVVEADAVLDAAIAGVKGRRSPTLALLHHRKSHVAAAGGDPQAQLALLQQAFTADKTNGEIAAELADLAETLEAWDLAVRVLRTITLIDADCPISRTQAFLRQARISYRRGDRQRAVLWARKARAESPDDPEVQAFLTSLDA